jgi:hypothetical protein
MMNSNTIPIKDEQAPARRFGALIAIIVICLGCACLAGGWYFFAQQGKLSEHKL